ncbi:MAG: DUF3341 domain-containing protein [Rhizobacter sp.]|nr:DUF3341 domain-containing protein [Rhizobacter sp.]
MSVEHVAPVGSDHASLMGEFATAEQLLAAARAARNAGHTQIEAYTPFHVEGLSQALGFKASRVPAATFLGGLVGGLGGFFMQWYSAVVDYPVNIGGRPLNSWPMFVPVTFETTVLGAALAAFAAVIVGSRLPRLRHPVFDTPGFELATRNRFFLCLHGSDPAYDPQAARRLLHDAGALRCTELRA